MEVAKIVKELSRELATRKSVYPNWVASGKLSAATADHRIAAIEEAILILEALEDQESAQHVQQELFA